MQLRICLTLLPALLCQPQTASAEFQLKTNDRVVFFGDTVVHAQLFTKYVESFVRVRYPKLETRFFNSGQRNETVADGLARLDRDLKLASPTVVVVAFGLHDPGGQPFDEARLAEFRKNIIVIAERIQKLGARTVLLTPPRPIVEQLSSLPDVNYAEVVGKYAQALREVGETHKIPVIDWFRSSSALYQESAPKPPQRRQGELLPKGLAHAVVAAQLLSHWQAEPIEVRITADWQSDVAKASIGEAKVKTRTEQELKLSLTDIPIPWGVAGVKPQDLEAARWPGAELCRYILKIENVPDPGIELILGGRTMAFDREQLRGGVNIMGWPPIQVRNRTLRDMLVAITRKHRRWFEYRLAVRRGPPPEPELLEASESSLRTLQLYERGYAKLILRLPKVFDVTLSFRVPPDDSAGGGADKVKQPKD
jgi:hypothetical protein